MEGREEGCELEIEMGIINGKWDSNHNTGSTAAKEFNGVVQFDLGEVTHSTFGSVHIKSQFPRIKPNFEREEINEETIETLKTKLMEWIQKHFDTSKKSKYFDEIAKASVLFSVYINPFSEICSQEMELAIKIYFWLWYTDDEIEMAIENGIPFESLKEGTDQLNAALNGTTEFKHVETYPFFEALFHSNVDLYLMIRKSEFPLGPTQSCLQKYFEAQRWFSVDTIDERYSEESFKTWRRIIAYFDGIAEIVALVEGVALSEEIRRSPSFQRILNIANAFGGFVNDLIGMKKEFANSQKDNLIVFKVLCKGMPLKLAVEEICGLMKSELQDYVLMKKVILREFNNDAELIKYIDILDSLIDGHNRIYAQSTRHHSVGCVTLTRNK